MHVCPRLPGLRLSIYRELGSQFSMCQVINELANDQKAYREMVRAPYAGIRKRTNEKLEG